jgi:alkylated DNA repair dioxygenase AlkB
MPPFLLAVLDKAKPYADGRFDQCIVTYYPKGAGIGWHHDAPCFGEVILGLSLLSVARLQFRPNGVKDLLYEAQVAPGSLYIIRGPARSEWEHRLVVVTEERYSLTFRRVLGGR